MPTEIKILTVALITLFIVITWAMCKVASDADDEAEKMQEGRTMKCNAKALFEGVDKAGCLHADEKGRPHSDACEFCAYKYKYEDAVQEMQAVQAEMEREAE